MERYRLERELGRGAAATVFLAHDERMDRAVAVKVLHEELAQALGHDRFLREIRIASQLRHPHIVPVLDFGQKDQQLWFVMPHVGGGTLRERLERMPQLRVDDALRWAGEIADALAYAHEKGFVHRDVKPENILVDGDHAWLADFGIARGIDATIAERLTSAGIVVGTPAYMSPEQASGGGELDGLSDVYSLTCVLYECLAGVPPFVGPNAQSVIAQRFSQAPHPIASYRSTVPIRVQEIISSGLQIVPADRPSARAMSVVLRAESTAETRLPTGGLPAIRTTPQRRSVMRLVAAGTAALAIVLAILLLGRRGWSSRVPLDSGRVVVYPLTVTGAPATAQLAAGVPILIGLALEGVPPLRWVEGDNLLSSPAPGAYGRGDYRARLDAARGAGAASFIDGAVLIGRDSTKVVMRLVSVTGDSVVIRAGASAAGQGVDVPTLALRAVGSLLPSLLEPGRRVDLSALSERRPSAIAAFLLGEKDFRRSRYVDALAHYQSALAQDSNLAIAALNAARCARSLFREDEARNYVQIALMHGAGLPGGNRALARGLQFFYWHQADSALAHLQLSAAQTPASAEIYAAMADVHYYVGVDGANADSASESLYSQAHRLDSTFTPALYHLAWLALRNHKPAEALRFLIEYRRGESPDTVFTNAVELAARCQTQGAERTRWDESVTDRSESLVMLGKVLVGGGADLDCSQGAFRAVFRKPGAPSRDHFGALLGLNAVYMLTGDTAALEALDRSPMGIALRVHNLMRLDDVARGGAQQSPVTSAKSPRKSYDQMGAEELWINGVWSYAVGRPEVLQGSVNALKRAVGRSKAAGDSARLRSLQARQFLVAGDTNRALAALTASQHFETFQALEWGAFNSMAADYWLLAMLQRRLGFDAAADTYARRLEHPYPLWNAVFLRGWLQGQLARAREDGNVTQIRVLSDRLDRLSGRVRSGVRAGLS